VRLPVAANSRALLIGSATHHSADLPDLPAVHNNLTGLGTRLTDPVDGGFRQNLCQIIADPMGLRDVTDALVAAQATMDTLVVYFAGHGLLDQRGELFLALPDTDPGWPKYTALAYDWIRQAILDSVAVNRVLLLDCCFSGRAMAAMGDPTALTGQVDVEGAYIITSSPANSTSVAPPGAQYTSFTGELLNLLEHGVDNGCELISLREIYRQLVNTCVAKGLPRPQQQGTATADSLALTRNPARRVRGRLRSPIGPARERGSRSLSEPALQAIRVDALAAYNRGSYRAAVGLFRDLVAEAPATHGFEHPVTLRLRLEFARAVAGMGAHEEAVRLLRDLAVDTAQVLGKDHEETLAVRQSLAEAMMAGGALETAAELMAGVRAEVERDCGPDHPSSIGARRIEAVAIAGAGDRASAARLLRVLAEDSARVLGIGHETTLDVQHSLADTSIASGDSEQVRVSIGDLRASIEGRYGPSHIKTFAVRHTEARARASVGDHRDVVRLLTALKADTTNALGEDHPLTLAVRQSLAEELGSAGDAAGAARELLDLAQARNHVLGPNHPDSRQTLRALSRYLGE
jgi:hypothetical protein